MNVERVDVPKLVEVAHEATLEQKRQKKDITEFVKEIQQCERDVTHTIVQVSFCKVFKFLNVNSLKNYLFDNNLFSS